MDPDAPIYYINRLTDEKNIEPVMSGGLLKFAYNTFLGRSLWGILFNHSFVSRLMGLYFSSIFSRRMISSFVKEQEIDLNEIELPLSEYRSFNAFFTRRLKEGCRSFEPKPSSLASPADGRILVYPCCKSTDAIPVKGADRTLNALCKEALPEGNYAVLIVRLCPADYHRFHFPCDAKRVGVTNIVRGKYHSVNPVALYKHPNVFVENARHITTLKSPDFGIFRYIEVGAFGVGSIVETTHQIDNDKMDEKGFFKFGGSTVILIFDANAITFDQDLINNTNEGLETRVHAGNEIAMATHPHA